MFDLHSHVLPKIDDGARNLDMSIAMLSMAKEQGIKTLAATPHCMADSEEGSAVPEGRAAEFGNSEHGENLRS